MATTRESLAGPIPQPQPTITTQRPTPQPAPPPPMGGGMGAYMGRQMAPSAPPIGDLGPTQDQGIGITGQPPNFPGMGGWFGQRFAQPAPPPPIGDLFDANDQQNNPYIGPPTPPWQPPQMPPPWGGQPLPQGMLGRGALPWRPWLGQWPTMPFHPGPPPPPPFDDNPPTPWWSRFPQDDPYQTPSQNFDMREWQQYLLPPWMAGQRYGQQLPNPTWQEPYMGGGGTGAPGYYREF